jgi:hypothetical protein
MNDKSESWHVNKNIPILTLIALTLQLLIGGAVFITWSAKMDIAVAQNTQAAAANEVKIDSLRIQESVARSGLKSEIRENERTANKLAVGQGKLQEGQVGIQRSLDIIIQQLGD